MDESALRAELKEVATHYETHFAHQSLASRDLGYLMELIDRLGSAVERGREAGNDEMVVFAREMEAHFLDESFRIMHYQAERSKDVASLEEWVRNSAGRYRRYFSGQARHSRDLGRLDEIVADLEQRTARLQALGSDEGVERLLSRITTIQARYREERQAIRETWRTGSGAERRRRLKRLAEAQLARAEDHLSGRAVLASSPALLRRVLGTLEEIRTSWLCEGMPLEEQEVGEVSQLSERIAALRLRCEQMDAEVLAALPIARSDALAETANEIVGRYRTHFAGRDRAQVDPDALSQLWEALWSVTQEMERLLGTEAAAYARVNLAKVRAELRRFEVEWDKIMRARGAFEVDGTVW